MRRLCSDSVKSELSVSVCSMTHTAWMLDGSLFGLMDCAGVAVGAISAPDLAGVWSQGSN